MHRSSSRTGSLKKESYSFFKFHVKGLDLRIPSTQEAAYKTYNLRYYIPITGTTLEMSVFWPTDTESRINELRFSEYISLSFKTRLTSVTCFCGGVT